MKLIIGTVLGLAAILLALSLTSTALAQPIPSDLVLIATNQIPRTGGLYSIANWPWYPPYPPGCWTSYAAQGVQFYYSPSLGANTVFMDDRELVAMQTALRLARRTAANDAPSVPGGDGGDSGDDSGSGWIGGP
jgi:hypothetical protein